MTPKTKKIIIIAVPILITIIVISMVILYFTTDFLKSNKTLFFKYMSQNIDNTKIIFDNKSEKEYINLLKQNKYEGLTEVSAKYIENMNTSDENKNNDINKLKLTIDSQSEYFNNYSYKNIELNIEDTNILKAEYIHENEKYGIRFPNKFNQFLTVKNQDLKQVATDAEFSEEQIQIIPDTIQEYDYNSVLSFTDEELEALKNKYIEIIGSNIPNDKYSKQKTMITIGENSIDTIAYSITINQEQANNLYIKILEQLRDDEIIHNKLSQFSPFGFIYNYLRNDENTYNTNFLQEQYTDMIDKKIQEISQNNIGTSEVKYTVYQLDGNTVRTQITEETREYTIDFDTTNSDNAKLKIHNKNANLDQQDEKTILITKNNENSDSTFSINCEKIKGDTTSKTEFSRIKQLNNPEVNVETIFKYNDGNSNELELKITNEIELNKDFERTIKLDDYNSAVANDYPGDLTSKWKDAIFEYLNEVKQNNDATIKNLEKIGLIKDFLGIKEEAVETESDITTEVDKNRFNAKFEFYTGKEKKKEEIVKMLEETKNGIKSAQVSYSNEGSSQGTKKLEVIRLEIEDQSNKPDLADSIKDMLEDSKTYKVELEKNSNDVVKTVTITVNK